MNKHKTMKALMSAMVAAMLLLPATAGAQRVGGDERQDDLYRQAMDLYQKQKYAAAQQIFDEVASGGRQAGQSAWQKADACYYAGVCSEKLDNDDAYYRLEEFLRLYPQSARQNMARFYLGNFYYARGGCSSGSGTCAGTRGRSLRRRTPRRGSWRRRCRGSAPSSLSRKARRARRRARSPCTPTCQQSR